MRKQFPACQKMEQQKLEAAAASKALLVIINTKSFQKQQPQFPTEKKKNGEAEPEHQNYDQFWTPSESIHTRRAGPPQNPRWRTLKSVPHWLLKSAPHDVTEGERSR